ncbi:phosphatidate cytidylyltransferase [uncultured Bifidobacterium sp.]|uniref:phosphatidate cytidylyltransferase n=1 Tax=uncultured Bifidobacterium sp. TaxID=165187 RepID=UPI0028DB3BB7|nr:phosphatidate cytidylyltransferase [uncultured Bifidobacterium sp.]
MSVRRPHDDSPEDVEQVVEQINRRAGRNMPQAVATAAVLVVIILACLWISMDLFLLLIVVFMILALWELRVDFATVGLHIPVVTLWICSTATLVVTYYSSRHVMAMTVAMALSMLAVVVMSTMTLSFGNRLSLAVADKLASAEPSARTESSFNHETGELHHSRLSHMAVSMFSLMYVPLLASCIVLPLTFNGHHFAHALVLVFLPALSDTGGLFAGAWFGRHRLSPRISPKKSVEGLAGSMLLATIGAYAIFVCTWSHRWADRWWVPLVAGVMVGIVGTFGDLCASMLKRDIGIKDMGHLLKGHGGVMDRVDSILLSAPFLAALLWMVGL